MQQQQYFFIYINPSGWCIVANTSIEGTPALRSFIYVDVGAPTVTLVQTLGWCRATPSITWSRLGQLLRDLPCHREEVLSGMRLQRPHAGGYKLYSYCLLLTKDIPALLLSLWVWVSLMSTNLRMWCHFKNCRSDILQAYSALPPARFKKKTAWLVADTPRAAWTSQSALLTDKENKHLLGANYWIEPIYQESCCMRLLDTMQV